MYFFISLLAAFSIFEQDVQLSNDHSSGPFFMLGCYHAICLFSTLALNKWFCLWGRYIPIVAKLHQCVFIIYLISLLHYMPKYTRTVSDVSGHSPWNQGPMLIRPSSLIKWYTCRLETYHDLYILLHSVHGSNPLAIQIYRPILHVLCKTRLLCILKIDDFVILIYNVLIEHFVMYRVGLTLNIPGLCPFKIYILYAIQLIGNHRRLYFCLNEVTYNLLHLIQHILIVSL